MQVSVAYATSTGDGAWIDLEMQEGTTAKQAIEIHHQRWLHQKVPWLPVLTHLLVAP